MYLLPTHLMHATFEQMRLCGRRQHECQAYWLSDWSDPDRINAVVHPRHRSHAYGFQVDDQWLNTFWSSLAKNGAGVRIQVHTHPGAAFHSPTDDAYPLLANEGFLSLVIPNFAMGRPGFDAAYLTEIQRDGRWEEVEIRERITLT